MVKPPPLGQKKTFGKGGTPRYWQMISKLRIIAQLLECNLEGALKVSERNTDIEL